jgi:hypothetical protein
MLMHARYYMKNLLLVVLMIMYSVTVTQAVKVELGNLSTLVQSVAFLSNRNNSYFISSEELNGFDMNQPYDFARPCYTIITSCPNGGFTFQHVSVGGMMKILLGAATLGGLISGALVYCCMRPKKQRASAQ